MNDSMHSCTAMNIGVYRARNATWAGEIIMRINLAPNAGSKSLD